MIDTFKSQQFVKKKKKKHKIGEIGKKKTEKSFFLLKMVSNALGTPRNTFESQR